MKRLFIFLTAFALLLSPSAFAQDASKPLALAEIEQFNQLLLDRAITDGLEPFAWEEGYLVRGEGYELLLSSGDLSGDSVVLSAALYGLGLEQEQPLEGPRGIRPDMKEEDLLALFPNDNPYLSGNEDSAVLYIAGELPAAVYAGFVLRRGRTLTLTEYDVYFQTQEGVSRAGIQVTIDQGLVGAVRSFFPSRGLSQEEAREALDRLRALQEETGYIAYGDGAGTRLTREDLVLAGLDFVDLTSAQAKAALGEPGNEETVSNSGGGSLMTLQWPGAEAVFRLEGETERAMRLTVREGILEGPRGLRIGDSLAQVISRFEHGEDLPDEGGALYGDAAGQETPFGVMVAGPEGDTLYYAVKTDKGNAALILEFIQGALVSMTLTYL